MPKDIYILLKHDPCSLDTLSNHLTFDLFFTHYYNTDLKRSLPNFMKISSTCWEVLPKNTLREEWLSKTTKTAFSRCTDTTKNDQWSKLLNILNQHHVVLVNFRLFGPFLARLWGHLTLHDLQKIQQNSWKVHFGWVTQPWTALNNI